MAEDFYRPRWMVISIFFHCEFLKIKETENINKKQRDESTQCANSSFDLITVVDILPRTSLPLSEVWMANKPVNNQSKFSDCRLRELMKAKIICNCGSRRKSMTRTTMSQKREI